MKRSEINEVIKKFEILLESNQFYIPPFLRFSPQEWKTKGREYDEIRENFLGWDVTDYGMGTYKALGLALITLRNGNVHNEKYSKVYAEKIIMLEEGQESPMHFHWRKMEDIINRGKVNVIFSLYNAGPNEMPEKSDVRIFRDGRTYMVRAGEEVVLKPGESLTLYPGCYHGFTIEKEKGPALIGEISMCNDDKMDNFFLEKLGRFPEIEEDEEPYRLLCTEYPQIV